MNLLSPWKNETAGRFRSSSDTFTLMNYSIMKRVVLREILSAPAHGHHWMHQNREPTGAFWCILWYFILGWDSCMWCFYITQPDTAVLETARTSILQHRAEFKSECHQRRHQVMYMVLCLCMDNPIQILILFVTHTNIQSTTCSGILNDCPGSWK